MEYNNGMNDWKTIPNNELIQKTAQSLKENGIEVFIAENGKEAKEKVLSLLPQKAEVMTMTSVTLDTIGVTEEIQKSEKYISIRNKLTSMDRATKGREMQQIGSTPEYAIGSVHAITWDGKILIASATGSQLPAYAYGSSHVILVVGAQKIVKDLDLGMKRIYEHSLPLESERAKKAYGVAGSSINKILIINNEPAPSRITVILVKEVLGF